MGDYGAMPKCDCKGTGYHGNKCAIPDCPAIGGPECPENYHCESNRLQPGKPDCVCNDSFCECPADYCNSKGVCQVQHYTDGLAKFVCDCFSGSYGETCQDTCNEQSCKNNGTCKLNGISHHCSCTYGWEGKSCEKKKSCLNYADLCLNEASCSEKGNCICLPGFDGEFCQFRNACFGKVCQRNSVCIVSSEEDDSFTCQCINDDCDFDSGEDPLSLSFVLVLLILLTFQ